MLDLDINLQSYLFHKYEPDMHNYPIHLANYIIQNNHKTIRLHKSPMNHHPIFIYLYPYHMVWHPLNQ